MTLTVATRITPREGECDQGIRLPYAAHHFVTTIFSGRDALGV